MQIIRKVKQDKINTTFVIHTEIFTGALQRNKNCHPFKNNKDPNTYYTLFIIYIKYSIKIAEKFKMVGIRVDIEERMV